MGRNFMDAKMMKQKKRNNAVVYCVLVLLGTFGAGITLAQEDHPVVASADFNVCKFGAVGDGTTLNTKSIQAAIDHCAESGGGRVVIPQGRFLSGGLLIRSNVELHLAHGSTLLASTRHEDFVRQPQPKYRSLKDEGGFYSLIYAEGAENIAITGSGTIDGQGKHQKPRPNAPAADQDGRPRNIMLISCKDVRVENIHMRNSGIWNQHYLNCEDVIVRGVTVYNHANRNNDAIDIDGCRRFVLSDSIFDTDDDGITIKSTGPAPSEDIVITNCVVSSFCNAIKAGTESTGGFRNITISNCVITPSTSREKPIFNSPRQGITGLTLIIVDGGTMEGINVNNLLIEGTMTPLYIRLGNRARPYMKGVERPGVGKIRNISISNVVAYGAGTWGCSFTGLPGHAIENISLSNIQLFTKGGVQAGQFKTTVREDERGYPQPSAWGNLPAYGLYIRHARGVTIDGLTLGTEAPDVRVPIMADDVQGLRVSNARLAGAVGTGSFVKGISLVDYEIEKPMGYKGDDDKVVSITDTPNRK